MLEQNTDQADVFHLYQINNSGRKGQIELLNGR